MTGTARTITMTHEGLVELLTTAACIGRDLLDKDTRGEIQEALGAYGLAPGNRLKVMAEMANRTAREIAIGDQS